MGSRPEGRSTVAKATVTFCPQTITERCDFGQANPICLAATSKNPVRRGESNQMSTPATYPLSEFLYFELTRSGSGVHHTCSAPLPDGPQVGRPPGAEPRRPADPGQVRGLGHDRSPRPKRPGASSVELPGLEPGSFATSPGLLRAQFARSLCSALRIRRTRPDDGPSQRWKSRRAPLTRPGGKSLSRCQTPDQGRIRADRHALALGSEGVVALSVLGAYQVAATLTVVSSLHRHASPGSIDEVETNDQPLFVSCGREVCHLPQEI